MLDHRTVGVRGALNSLNRRRLHLGPPTLLDRAFPGRLLMDVILIACGAAIVALSAQFVVPLGSVPSTGQIVGVLAVGYGLGALRGGLALVLYIAIGALGVPVFNQGGAGGDHVMGDTGGYLAGFILAAVLAGLWAAKGWDRDLLSNLAGSMVALVIVYTFGVARLMSVRELSLGQALEQGFLPLVLAGVLKALLVSVAIPLAWRIDSMGRVASTPLAIVPK